MKQLVKQLLHVADGSKFVVGDIITFAGDATSIKYLQFLQTILQFI